MLVLVLLQVLPPVEALLDVCAHPDHEISDMSFTFWHKLSRQLTAGSLHEQQQQLQTQQFPPPPGSPLAGGAQSQGDQMQAEQQRRREFFAPCFERLASLVRGRMRCAGFLCGLLAIPGLMQTLVVHTEIQLARQQAGIFENCVFCSGRHQV